ncbi:hypothetical protein JFY56_24175, partial [Pseudomonas sp. Milli4]|nr:hypothetical protein [Pseudomonas schmalbachii]
TNLDGRVDKQGADTATHLGGGAAYTASTGAISAPSYALTKANSIVGTTGAATDVGTGFSKVDAALGDLDTRIDNIDSGTGFKYFHANSTLADSSATGTDSIAAGPTAKSTATNSIAIGKGATASTANSVALGDGATTAAAVTTATGTVAGTSYNYAGGTPTGTVSVGNGTANRTITNVAAGRVSGTSTDAINGSQLYATNQEVGKLDTRI